MKQLTVNGIDFTGDLPGEWTIAELVRILEAEVLLEDEIVIDVSVDGAPYGFAPGEAGPRLQAIDRVTVEARRIEEIVAAAVDSADQAIRRFVEETDAVVKTMRLGDEQAGWAAQRHALGTLEVVVDLAERLGTTLCGGLGPGPAKGDEVRVFAVAIGERLIDIEAATTADDLVDLADGMEDLADWLPVAWGAIWATPSAPETLESVE